MSSFTQIKVDELPKANSYLLLEIFKLEEPELPYEGAHYGFMTRVDYSLVLFSPHDVRCKEGSKFLKLDMGGGTKSTREIDSWIQEGEIDTPFRDGVHILWDSIALNLPMYIKLGDEIRRLGATIEARNNADNQNRLNILKESK